MRAFVAIDLAAALGAEIVQLQAQVPVGRSVPKKNLHLTVAFLGDQSAAALEALHEELDALTVEPFTLRLAGFEPLGGSVPKVLTLRVDPCAELLALENGVRRAARLVGAAPERKRFHPHVTITRFGGGLKGNEAARLGHFLSTQSVPVLPEVMATSFSLFESVLTPERAVHHILADYPFVGFGEAPRLS
ncbi:RNA 2',3'-cyclic phosphodiesterase [Shimia abyssi]|uniref:RNA 2',3'-cyclic phosphodiesterase n=1 Tax=Shimia abyssi TaxID=1662395 RepID=A0A2P8FHF0_9RHOB|nr:RNA 2',3'-cyclic phosphodiesterase [Shimia abyssi]PSL21184.1 2'-5' RNA ligase [Shimia abyssi]